MTKFRVKGQDKLMIIESELAAAEEMTIGELVILSKELIPIIYGFFKFIKKLKLPRSITYDGVYAGHFTYEQEDGTTIAGYKTKDNKTEIYSIGKNKDDANEQLDKLLEYKNYYL